MVARRAYFLCVLLLVVVPFVSVRSAVAKEDSRAIAEQLSAYGNDTEAATSY